MLVGGRNKLLLSDFGIATVAQSSRYQGTQDMAGTIAYMAPEQIGGKPRPTSDQYSLGIVVYEWLSGERPFQGSFTEIAAQHVQTAPPPLREKLPTLSPAVEQVVMTALTKDPKQRFASVLAFATALEQANIERDGLVPRRGGGGDVGRGGPLRSPTAGVSSFASTRPASSDKNVKPQIVSTPDSIPVYSTPVSDAVSTPSAQPVIPPKHLISRPIGLVGLSLLTGVAVVGGGAILWLLKPLIALSVLIIWLIIGLITGFVATRVIKGPHFGIIGDVVIGLVGAFWGGLIALILFPASFGTLILAVIGAIILLVIIHFVAKAMGHPVVR